MNPTISEGLNLIFRWIHVIAGVMWIGHLYFFNFVNAQVAKTYDADSKKKVIPELMPRALYWFRWGAAYTWITGFLLLFIVYYHGGVHTVDGTLNWGQTGIAIALLVVGFLVYDILYKSGLGKNPFVGAVVMVLLVMGVTFALDEFTDLSARSIYIHVGALLGTCMAGNVWMRIWPAQRKIIAAIKGGNAPDAALAGLAATRSKHNTYMSVPLLFLMVSNHFATVLGAEPTWGMIGGFTVVGFLMCWLMYSKSGQSAPSSY